MAKGNTNAIVTQDVQTKTVSLSMSSGDQVISPDSGKLLTQVTVEKPATLVAGNIKNGVNIGGVTGNYSGLVPSGNINITSTSQVDVTNYATAQVVDANLIAGNIKKDVDVLGVTGTYEGGGMSAPSNSIEQTFKVATGESVAAGDFVQAFTLSGNNNLNPSGSTLADMIQLDVNKYAILYDVSSSTYIQLVEISNDTIYTGTAVQLSYSYASKPHFLTLIDDNKTKIGLVYNNSSSQIKIIVYSISDLTLTQSQNSVIYNGSSYMRIYAAKQIDDNKCLVVFTDYTSSYSDMPFSIVFTVGESSITKGSINYVLTNNSTVDSYAGYANIQKLSDGKILVLFASGTTAYYCVYTVNGTALTIINRTGILLNTNYKTALYQLNKPLYMNGKFFTYETYYSSSGTNGRIFTLEYDESNSSLTKIKTYTHTDKYCYAGLVQVNATQFLAIEYLSSTNATPIYSNTKLALYSVANDGTVTRDTSISLSGNSTSYTIALLFALSNNSVYVNIVGINANYTTTSNTITKNTLYAESYIKKAEDTTTELMLSKETKTAGQSCVVYRLRTYYLATLNLTNITSSSNNVKVPIIGDISITLSADTGYTLPSSITVTGCTSSYNSTTGVVSLSNATGAVTITASGVATPSEYSITVSGYEYNSYGTFYYSKDDGVTWVQITADGSLGNDFTTVKFKTVAEFSCASRISSTTLNLEINSYSESVAVSDNYTLTSDVTDLELWGYPD